MGIIVHRRIGTFIVFVLIGFPRLFLRKRRKGNWESGKKSPAADQILFQKKPMRSAGDGFPRSVGQVQHGGKAIRERDGVYAAFVPEGSRTAGNADTAGISEKGRTSAHGTRWFFPYAPRIIPSLSNSIAAFMTFLGE